MDDSRSAWRAFFVVAPLILVAQLAVVWGSFYIATDDYLIMTFGRGELALESLFARQAGGTPAIRPISLLISRLEYLAFGEAAMPRLVVNAVFHLLSGLMLALLVDGLFKRTKVAIMTGLLFLAWPLHAEGLAWFHSGHTSIPVGLFTLTVLTAFARGWPLFIGLLFLSLALLTRENAVVTGPVLLAIAWNRDRRLFPAIRAVWPYLVLLVAYVSIRAWQVLMALQADAALPIGQDPVMTVAYLCFHLIGPVHPAIPGAWGILVATCLAIITAAFATRHRVGICIFWVVVCCLPFAPLYDTGDPLFEAASSAYERRWYHLYLPAAGVAWLLANAVSDRQRIAVATVLGALVLQLMNAHWYADLGRELRKTHERLAGILVEPRPIALVIPEETLLGGLVEHQVLDIPRIFPDKTPIIYRWLPDGDGTEYVRAGHDPFGYPKWNNLPKSFTLPQDTQHFYWDETQRDLVTGNAPLVP
jgi:hypothetical protein